MTDDPINWNAGDHHRWVRPAADPCPDCVCCSARLCKRAITRDSACHLEGARGGDYDPSKCPCWQRGSAARVRLGHADRLDLRLAELMSAGMDEPVAHATAWREIHGPR